jgi:hypothetical protein
MIRQTHAKHADGISLALAELRFSVLHDRRCDIANRCDNLARAVRRSPTGEVIDGDCEDEISATLDLIQKRITFGMSEWQRPFLATLVSAAEAQIALAGDLNESSRSTEPR